MRARLVLPVVLVAGVAVAAGTALAGGTGDDDVEAAAAPQAVTLSTDQLEELHSVSGDDYVRRSMALPDVVVTGGQAPDVDAQPAGPGDGAAPDVIE